MHKHVSRKGRTSEAVRCAASAPSWVLLTKCTNMSAEKCTTADYGQRAPRAAAGRCGPLRAIAHSCAHRPCYAQFPARTFAHHVRTAPAMRTQLSCAQICALCEQDCAGQLRTAPAVRSFLLTFLRTLCAPPLQYTRSCAQICAICAWRCAGLLRTAGAVRSFLLTFLRTFLPRGRAHKVRKFVSRKLRSFATEPRGRYYVNFVSWAKHHVYVQLHCWGHRSACCAAVVRQLLYVLPRNTTHLPCVCSTVHVTNALMHASCPENHVVIQTASRKPLYVQARARDILLCSHAVLRAARYDTHASCFKRRRRHGVQLQHYNDSDQQLQGAASKESNVFRCDVPVVQMCAGV